MRSCRRDPVLDRHIIKYALPVESIAKVVGKARIFWPELFSLNASKDWGHNFVSRSVQDLGVNPCQKHPINRPQIMHPGESFGSVEL